MKIILKLIAIFISVGTLVLFIFSDHLTENFKIYQTPLDSMSPGISSNDRVVIATKAYKNKLPLRGDIVVFLAPFDAKKIFMKRIVGLPGDKLEIKNGGIYVDGVQLSSDKFPKNRQYLNADSLNYGAEGQIIEVPESMYYVLGDKSSSSSDSRQWGFVPLKNIIGKATVVSWPPQRWRVIQ